MILGIWKNDNDIYTDKILNGTHQKTAIFFGEVIFVDYSKEEDDLQIWLPNGQFTYIENFSGNYHFSVG